MIIQFQQGSINKKLLILSVKEVGWFSVNLLSKTCDGNLFSDNVKWSSADVKAKLKQ